MMDRNGKREPGFTIMDVMVGDKVRAQRKERKLSLRNLADMSGLNINTLSLIENGKVSPSVSTLQRLASGLGVTISAFFDPVEVKQSVVITRAANRPYIKAEGVTMENLTENLMSDYLQTFTITLEPGYSSGDRHIRHTGYEFGYVLEGQIVYSIEGVEHTLGVGDSLLFNANIHHSWQNQTSEPARFMLLISPRIPTDDVIGRHVIR